MIVVRRSAVLGSATLLGTIAAACAEVGGGPTTVVSLGFDTSTVAVVVGDTLRDTLGRPLPLRAVAFNAAGDTIPEPAVVISYLVAPRDTADTAAAVRVAGALVIGTRLRDTPARVFAVAGGLQSLPKSIDVIRRPTRLLPVAPVDSALYVVPAGRSAVSAGGGQLRVAADAADSVAGVRRVIVRFAVERAAPRIADSVAIIDERQVATRSTGELVVPRSLLDTTDSRGLAGRRVLVYLRQGATAVDTVVLRATVAYPARFTSTMGASQAALAADTVRITVAVRPQAATR